MDINNQNIRSERPPLMNPPEDSEIPLTSDAPQTLVDSIGLWRPLQEGVTRHRFIRTHHTNTIEEYMKQLEKDTLWEACPICKGTGTMISQIVPGFFTYPICTTCEGDKIINKQTGFPPKLHNLFIKGKLTYEFDQEAPTKEIDTLSTWIVKPSAEETEGEVIFVPIEKFNEYFN
jgi:hypothetical protein